MGKVNKISGRFNRTERSGLKVFWHVLSSMSRGMNHETKRAALLSQVELIGQRLEDWQGVGK